MTAIKCKVRFYINNIYLNVSWIAEKIWLLRCQIYKRLNKNKKQRKIYPRVVMKYVPAGGLRKNLFLFDKFTENENVIS